MSEPDARRTIPGSERPPVTSGTAGRSAVPAGSPVEATVVLRRRAALPDSAVLSTSAELGERHGADPADVELVTRTLTDLGVEVTAVDAASRRLRIAGPAGVLAEAFGTSLAQGSTPDATGAPVAHRLRTGGLSVPAVLDGVVTAVLGLDDRPQARARFRVATAAAAAAGYTPVELGRVYAFPAGSDGSGQTVAIVELGGGFAQSELDTYFRGLGITGPTVTAVGVDGGANVAGQDPQGADGEVLLDIEVAGALAPGADLVVYFAPNTDAGFLDAVAQAAHATPAPAAISISWGGAEDTWTGQARTAFDDALADAAALGVTVTVAAGDDGSRDGATDETPRVDFPASSPYALACGGTRLDADAATGVVTSEVVWNNGTGRGATGGGVSTVFPLPSWQGSAGVPAGPGGKPGRGVPDVSAVADPQTGYRIRVDGQDLVIGGTSAVAPLWAALVARLVQAGGRRLGLLQPKLYGAAGAGFRDITVGNNGAYQAGAGWDACTGLGVPVGTALGAVLT